VLALVLVYYGAMLLALALKASPETINSISLYGSAYDTLAGIAPGDIDGQARLIAGISGLVALLVFGFLAIKGLPRPYLARSDLRLAAGDRGVTEISPRAIERAAESAALGQRAVRSARGRYGTEDLTVEVSVSRPREVADLLRDVQRRVRESLERHELPPLPVNVTLTGFEPKQQRELS
jgi:hypothetical protein